MGTEVRRVGGVALAAEQWDAPATTRCGKTKHIFSPTSPVYEHLHRFISARLNVGSTSGWPSGLRRLFQAQVL